MTNFANLFSCTRGSRAVKDEGQCPGIANTLRRPSARNRPQMSPSTWKIPLDDMDTFKKIYIEVTNRCNLSCSFCHTSDRPKAFMQPAEFEDILVKIQGFTKFIYLHVLGEALLHPRLNQLLEASHRQGYQVNLSTNGSLLQEKGDLLLASPAVRQLNISLHSCEHLNGPKLDAYVAGILAFAEKAREQQASIWLNLRLWDVQEDKDGPGWPQNARILAGLQNFFALPDHFAVALTPGQSITLAPRIFLSRERRFDWPHRATEITGCLGTCRGLRDHIAILVDGCVVPCCLDAEADILLGNIHQQELQQILASSRARQMREGFSHQRLIESLCQRCNYRMRFC